MGYDRGRKGDRGGRGRDKRDSGFFGEDNYQDRGGFDDAMARQKAAARAAWKGSGEAASDEIWFDMAEREGATEDGTDGVRRATEDVLEDVLEVTHKGQGK